MTLHLQRLCFTFQAHDTLRFPPSKAGNTLRGAFGLALREIHCQVDCPGVRICPKREACAYARIFEPSPLKPGPSGFANWPRPYVIQPSGLDGSNIPAGGRFSFYFNLFEVTYTGAVVEAFQSLQSSGLGARRSRVRFEGVTCEGIGVDLLLSRGPVGKVLVKFLTPTSLKGGTVPSFGLLAARVRDRVSTISALYGEGAVPMDFSGYGRRAASVAIARCAIVPVEAQRRSSRTGQTYMMGGFVGEVQYEGDLTEFIPLFRAATYTGVGTRASWGDGQIQIEY